MKFEEPCEDKRYEKDIEGQIIHIDVLSILQKQQFRYISFYYYMRKFGLHCHTYKAKLTYVSVLPHFNKRVFMKFILKD